MRGGSSGAVMWGLLLGLFVGLVVPQRSNETVRRERDALVAFFNAAGGSEWTNSTGWLQNDPCSSHWFGVQCEDGSVSSLYVFGSFCAETRY
jgi:hypothetical protein